MPHNLHRAKASEKTADGHRSRAHRDVDALETLEPNLVLQRLGDPSSWHSGAFDRMDGNARGRLITTLQRTLGNNHVQRLIVGDGTTPSRIHRCGGGPCGCASEDDGVRRVQRLGQTELQEQPPRSASLTVVSPPPRRDEEETRPSPH